MEVIGQDRQFAKDLVRSIRFMVGFGASLSTGSVAGRSAGMDSRGWSTSGERGAGGPASRGEALAGGARDILKSDGVLRGVREARFEVIERWHRRLGVRAMCRELGVSRSGFYAWRQRPERSRRRQDRRLLVEIRAFYRASRCHYGSPRIWKDLREAGYVVSEKRVARLMPEDGLVGTRRRRFRSTTDSSLGWPVAANVLDRAFTVESPDTVWAGDITYIPTQEGWLYLAILLDLCSRYVVGWATSESLADELTLEALDQALVVSRPPAANTPRTTISGSSSSAASCRA